MPNARLFRNWSSSLALLLLLTPASFSSASEVLVRAEFETDVVGAMARPGGPPTVEEEVYDASNTTEGVSAVEEYLGGKRYRLSDVGSGGGVRAIRLPLSRDVSLGRVTLKATVSAGQIGNGGGLALVRPDEEEWIAHVAFGAGGTFRVHGSATTFTYAPGVSYCVDATVTFGSPTTVDYTITDLSDPMRVLHLDNCPVAGQPVARVLRYSTAVAADGSFSIDDVEVGAE